MSNEFKGSNESAGIPLQIQDGSETEMLDLNDEVDRFFDETSIAADQPPRLVLIMGGVAAGKTTHRRKHFSQGYVLIDAAEIFLRLSRGHFFPFPPDEEMEAPMELIGSLVSDRAVKDRQNIVTELIGADYELAKGLINTFKEIGYCVQIVGITCPIEDAQRRNLARGDDSISAFYAEPYHIRWLLGAATSEDL